MMNELVGFDKFSQAHFYKIFNVSPCPMAISEYKSGRYLYVNESFLNVLGYQRNEVVGLTSRELNMWVNSEDRARAIKSLQENRVLRDYEVYVRTKSGGLRYGMFSAELIDIEGQEYIVSLFHDLTEQRKAQQGLERLDSLNLIGQMAAAIGHEVRNPLAVVRGFLQLLGNKDKYADDEKYFKLMISELDRANSVITEFLSLAGNKPFKLIPQDINKILSDLYPLIHADGLSMDIDVKLELMSVPDIKLCNNEIRQLVLNLVRNALDAAPGGGCVLIKTYSDENEVVLSVTDDGTGIQPEILNKLGTPFFTTKPAGTGLGLAICYSIANRHNAKIEIDSGQFGTTFFIRFKVDN